MSIQVGQKGRAESTVTTEQTAKAMGSGALPVYSTPCLVALIEEACWKSIQPSLEDGQGSVGTSMSLTHEASSPVGMQVWADSEVTAVDGRKVTFKVTAQDKAGVIAHASHERFVIKNDKFLSKCNAKLENK